RSRQQMEQQRAQHSDNRDHHQHLNQRETIPRETERGHSCPQQRGMAERGWRILKRFGVRALPRTGMSALRLGGGGVGLRALRFSHLLIAVRLWLYPCSSVSIRGS